MVRSMMAVPFRPVLVALLMGFLCFVPGATAQVDELPDPGTLEGAADELLNSSDDVNTTSAEDALNEAAGTSGEEDEAEPAPAPASSDDGSATGGKDSPAPGLALMALTLGGAMLMTRMSRR